LHQKIIKESHQRKSQNKKMQTQPKTKPKKQEATRTGRGRIDCYSLIYSRKGKNDKSATARFPQPKTFQAPQKMTRVERRAELLRSPSPCLELSFAPWNRLRRSGNEEELLSDMGLEFESTDFEQLKNIITELRCKMVLIFLLLRFRQIGF
jgi:hypothetical protein